MSNAQLLGLAVGVLVGLAALHWLSRLGLYWLRVALKAPVVRSTGRWAREHPSHAGLGARFPRSYPFLLRRLSPRAFSGLPLTLLSTAAVYLLALLGGLIEDLLRQEGMVQFDADINAFFGSYRVKPLLDALESPTSTH